MRWVGAQMAQEGSRGRRLLRVAPSLVPFAGRVACLRKLISLDRAVVRQASLSASLPPGMEELFMGGARLIQVAPGPPHPRSAAWTLTRQNDWYHTVRYFINPWTGEPQGKPSQTPYQYNTAKTGNKGFRREVSVTLFPTQRHTLATLSEAPRRAARRATGREGGRVACAVLSNFMTTAIYQY